LEVMPRSAWFPSCRLPDYAGGDPGDLVLWAVSWAFEFGPRQAEAA
jgi:hypothetical protein